ncbi:MAG: TM2 domain-containing protein [Gemmatimonadetes bacterium]|nr:TM2 domain-containing protein [Gemmatimonadota bacterium]
MTEQPNEPGRANPEGSFPPYAVVPLQPTAPIQSPGPQVPDDPDGMYKDGIGYGLWCLIFFGLAGVHRLYLGKYGTGILWLLTFGLFGIGQFIDLIRMKGLIKEANVREGYLPHPRLARRMQPAQATASPRLPPQQNLQQVLLKAAQANGGALTVTQGVVATGMTFEQVEEILSDMVAKGYVDVDNAPNSGVVVYRFPELAGPFS